MCIKIGKKLILSILVVVILIAFFSVPSVVSAVKTKVKTIVIDPGHGGMDSGVVTGDGVKESDLVLALSLLLADYFESGGFKVVLTRKNQSALTQGKFVKKTDMQKRLEVIKRAEPLAVISLHLNSYVDKNRRGVQCFYFDERSLSLAGVMQDFVNDDFNNPQLMRDFSPLRADKYLLRNSPCPAVIVECGFLSNHLDKQNLLDEKYRHRLAYTLFQGVVAWLSKN